MGLATAISPAAMGSTKNKLLWTVWRRVSRKSPCCPPAVSRDSSAVSSSARVFQSLRRRSCRAWALRLSWAAPSNWVSRAWAAWASASILAERA